MWVAHLLRSASWYRIFIGSGLKCEIEMSLLWHVCHFIHKRKIHSEINKNDRILLAETQYDCKKCCELVWQMTSLLEIQNASKNVWCFDILKIYWFDVRLKYKKNSQNDPKLSQWDLRLRLNFHRFSVLPIVKKCRKTVRFVKSRQDLSQLFL